MTGREASLDALLCDVMYVWPVCRKKRVKKCDDKSQTGDIEFGSWRKGERKLEESDLHGTLNLPVCRVNGHTMTAADCLRMVAKCPRIAHNLHISHRDDAEAHNGSWLLTAEIS